jgi:hypothetical protein
MKFAAQSERFSPEQKSLLEDEIEADLAAVATEIDALAQTQTPATPEKKQAIGPVTLNPERDSIIQAYLGDPDKQPVAA